MSTANMIRARVAEVDKRLADLETTVRLLRDEREELQTALKVINRFADDDDAAPIEPDLEARRVDLAGTEPEPVKSAKSSKPPGTIPIADMIIAILSEASVRGTAGLLPKEMVPIIRERWWPEARGESIGSIAWRMASKGQLLSEEGRYFIPAPPSGQLFADAKSAGDDAPHRRAAE